MNGRKEPELSQFNNVVLSFVSFAKCFTVEFQGIKSRPQTGKCRLNTLLVI